MGGAEFLPPKKLQPHNETIINIAAAALKVSHG
jgi:hypothetical protein